MKKMMCVILAVLLLVGSFAGCAGDGGETSKTETSKTETSKTETSKAESSKEEVKEFSYPMEGDVTISVNLEDYDMADVPDYAKDNYFWEMLQENTGINLEFIGAVSNPAEPSQEFLLLLASGEYPDMFQCNWIGFPGGPTAALVDGYIQPLDQYAEWLPNLHQFLAENPDIDRMIRNDASELYATPWLREAGTEVGAGLVIREDWLDAVGKEVPTTVDELTDAMVAIKDEFGLKNVLTFELRWLWLQYTSAPLSSAFDCVYPYFVNDGTVEFGPLTEGYKEFVSTMASWYAQGLLDTDFATVDKSTVQAKFANGEVGVAIQQYSNVTNCIDVLTEADPSYKVAAIPSLVKNEGDTPKFSHYWAVFDGGYQFTMSTQTDKAEAVCRFMDYSYSPEGINLCAYGTEGVSYEADENGNFVKFTDVVLNNPLGDAPSTVRNYFAHPANWTYPSRDLNYFVDEEVLGIMETWTANMPDYVFPAVTYTADENAIVSAKYSTLDTYCREQITKFILGTSPMEEWDSFVEDIKGLGAEELRGLAQDAYNRYMAR